MKIRNFSILIILTVLFLAACNSNSEDTGAAAENDTGGSTDAKTTVYNINVSASEQSQIAVGIKKFKEELERLSDNKYSVKPHYNNGLGGERESIEGMQLNTIDLGSTSTGTLGGFVPEFFVFDLPYLFKDRDHAYAVLDGDIGKDLAQKLEEQTNVVVLGYQENGYRNLSNSSHPVNSLEDLKGLDHRTQESAVQVSLWNALGANPTPMSWPEVYSALQQGVVESQDNPFSIIYDSKFQEVQKYLTRTNHIYSPNLIMIGKKLFDSLPSEDQAIFREAGQIAAQYQRGEAVKMDEDMLQLLLDDGMELTEPDLEPFIQAVQGVHDEFADEIGEDLINSIKNLDY